MAPVHSDRLLADIGGTNARFGLQAGPQSPITDVQVLPCDQHATIDDAIGAYLRLVRHEAPPACAIAIANPVVGDRVAMTNHHWAFSISALKARVGFDRLLVLNDFTALALALPMLPTTDLQQVGGGVAIPGRAIGLIGPGTGLGVSGLMPSGDDATHRSWVPLIGEGGHVTLAGSTVRENAVLTELGRRHGHVSAERAVSGQGLVDIHRALVAIDAPGAPQPALEAAEITRLAEDGDAGCAEALDLFCAFLGTVVGNLALTLGAQGGMYIGGGIVPQLGERFARSPFRQRFEEKGRFRAYLAAIPVFVIHARESPALLGAACALDSRSPRFR